jgi:serine/threonine protein kinase
MFDLIKKRKRLTIPETQYFLYQLIDGLCYLHNKQIIHREYSPTYPQYQTRKPSYQL